MNRLKEKWLFASSLLKRGSRSSCSRSPLVYLAFSVYVCGTLCVDHQIALVAVVFVLGVAVEAVRLSGLLRPQRGLRKLPN